MRVLVVSHTFPWPENSGGRLRVANIVRALSRIGEVDLFCMVSRNESRESNEIIPTLDEPIARIGCGIRRGVPYRVRRVARWMVGSRLPYEIGARDYSGVRAALQSWAQPPYDLVWISHAESFSAIGDLVDAPTIVDLDDLEDQKMAAKLEAGAGGTHLPHGVRATASRALLHRWGARVHTTVNSRRWKSLQRRIAASVDAIAVCSGLDQQRLRVPSCAVVPNGYSAPVRPVGQVEVGQPPTLVLAGSFSYTPNADAARYLAQEVLPRVRDRIPEARVRLVGHHDDRIEDLAAEDVILTGRVPDMAAELARADVVVVPIRFGGGTRIKILEAFAHRIPVVSTSVGCEGLEVAHGEHLLIADDPDGLAESSALLLTDLATRRALVDRAHDLYTRRYTWDMIALEIAELGRRVARSNAAKRTSGAIDRPVLDGDSLHR
jgi:glycosyltransferase involved in cell wall biosynthesis